MQTSRNFWEGKSAQVRVNHSNLIICKPTEEALKYDGLNSRHPAPIAATDAHPPLERLGQEIALQFLSDSACFAHCANPDRDFRKPIFCSKPPLTQNGFSSAFFSFDVDL